MARAIWSGNLSFGLVHVPVRVVAAVEDRSVRFHRLHREDKVRVDVRMVCPEDGEELSLGETVRGKEVEPGHYVTVTDAEFAALAPGASRTMEVLDFVPLRDIDPVYFERPYHLAPQEGSEHAYAVLREAMVRRDRVAVVRFVMRTKEYLAAVRAVDGGLALYTLRHHDEVPKPHDVGAVADTRPTEREVDTAVDLIDAMAAPFEPDRYHDVYRERLLDLIEKKAVGRRVPAPEPPPVPEPPGDLLDALRRSVQLAREHQRAPGTR